MDTLLFVLLILIAHHLKSCDKYSKSLSDKCLTYKSRLEFIIQ